MSPPTDHSGTWRCVYWFPSNQHPGQEEPSEYQVRADQTGNQLILQSLPNDSQSYLLLRLVIDGIFASGSWTENTSPQGEFAGMIYSGVVQLLISDDGRRMTGKWVGVGRDVEKQRPDIYGGRWELSRIS